jgi:hypothetical protein
VADWAACGEAADAILATWIQSIAGIARLA